MKHFACGDVVPGCATTFTERSEPALLASVARHAAAAHGIATPGPDLVASVLAHTRTL